MKASALSPDTFQKLVDQREKNVLPSKKYLTLYIEKIHQRCLFLLQKVINQE